MLAKNVREILSYGSPQTIDVISRQVSTESSEKTSTDSLSEEEEGRQREEEDEELKPTFKMWREKHEKFDLDPVFSMPLTMDMLMVDFGPAFDRKALPVCILVCAYNNTRQKISISVYLCFFGKNRHLLFH